MEKSCSKLCYFFLLTDLCIDVPIRSFLRIFSAFGRKNNRRVKTIWMGNVYSLRCKIVRETDKTFIFSLKRQENDAKISHETTRTVNER